MGSKPPLAVQANQPAMPCSALPPARSLVFTYCNANPGGFHRLDAAGYIFWADHVLALDAINPQMAARLARALDRWQKLAPPYREAAREAIARVAAKADLSNDVREVVARALGE